MNIEVLPFSTVREAALDVRNKVLALETAALVHLPGIQWDFSKLAEHLDELAGLIGDGLALKAMKSHKNFAVSSPGSLLGRISSARKRAVARAVASIGGRSTSVAKREACRANARVARMYKAARFEARYGSSPGAIKGHVQLKRLRNRLSRAKCELRRLAKERDAFSKMQRLKVQERTNSIRDEIEKKHQALDRLHKMRWKRVMNTDPPVSS